VGRLMQESGTEVSGPGCEAQMDSTMLERAERQVRAFFREAQALDPVQVRRLRRAARHAPGRLALETDPQFLAVVTSGAWTPEMDRLAHQVRTEAAAVAHRLSPAFGRRAVARGLADAALVVLTDCESRTALSAGLRSQLARAWDYAQNARPVAAPAA
jgi:hypothetical protein